MKNFTLLILIFLFKTVYAQAQPTTAASVPTASPANVLSIFGDAYTNLANTNINPNWGQATVTTEVQVGGKKTIKMAGLNYQGIALGSPDGSPQDVSAYNAIHLDYWTADAVPFKFFLISQATPNAKEVAFPFTVTTGQWIGTDIPLTAFTAGANGVDLTKVFQFKFEGNNTSSGTRGTIYIQNIYFTKTGSTPPPTSTEPTTAASIPTALPADVLSIFGDTYTNLAATNINPNWGQATVTTEVQVGGKKTIKMAGLNYQGIALGSPDGSPQDVSAYNAIHLDYWTADAIPFKFFLISQATPNAKEVAYPFTVTTGQWVGTDIPLTAFTAGANGVDLTKVFQFKFEGNNTGTGAKGTVYFQNIYFTKTSVTPPATEPTIAAPIPTTAASNVLSIFGDAYTNLAATNINPNWGQATVTTEVQVGGKKTIKMAGLNYQGIALGSPDGSPQDVSAYNAIHLDYWTADAIPFKFFLISQATPNAKEVAYPFTVTTGQWVGTDIPLTAFTAGANGVDLTKVFQFKFEGNNTGTGAKGTVYFQNIYFTKAGTTPPPNLTQMNLPVTFDDITVNYGLVGFGGAENSTIFVDPTLATNKVAKVVKSAGAELWAGTTITAVNGNIQTGFSSKIPFTSTNKKMNIRVWSPNAGIKIRLKVEDANDVNKYVEVDVTNTVANNWEVLTFDFANPATAAFDASFNYNKASIFFNFGVTGATAGEKTYYFDDVNFGAPKQAQTITFAALTDKTLGDAAFTLAATASSSLAVAYTTTTSDKITLGGTQVTLVKAGRASVTAAQAGNDSYFPATPITQTFCIKPAKPTITTGTATATGVTLTSNATAGNQWYLNGNAITGATNSTYIATAAGTYKVQVKVDDCISDFSADNVITKSAQTITFPAITTKTLTSAAFTLGATASSGLAVTYATTSTDKITLVGNQVTAVKAAGKATITATQTGNDLVASATAVSVDFCITPAKPTVTTSGINTAATVLTSSATTGNQWYLGATAISGATSPTYTIAAAGIYKVQVTIDGCASDFSAESTFIVTGDLTSQNSSIVVYPNPVETSLQIKGLSGESFTAQVVDLTGRATSILLEKTDDAHKANVEGLSQGFYVLTVREGGQLVKLKFIKK